MSTCIMMDSLMDLHSEDGFILRSSALIPLYPSFALADPKTARAKSPAP